ncbi:hypothetical protein K438DRAFT_1758777 [Mycena galopus ATCC 62051]|nr:hypothetical protein K438DRAFT_1758777 [Mycena galopus ATCC 62051]
MSWFWSSNNPRSDAHKERLAARKNAAKERLAGTSTLLIWSFFGFSDAPHSASVNETKERIAIVCRLVKLDRGYMDLARFVSRTIVGGTGGKGGKSRKEGGHGGAGEASKLTFEQAASYNRTQESVLVETKAQFHSASDSDETNSQVEPSSTCNCKRATSNALSRGSKQVDCDEGALNHLPPFVVLLSSPICPQESLGACILKCGLVTSSHGLRSGIVSEIKWDSLTYYNIMYLRELVKYHLFSPPDTCT